MKKLVVLFTFVCLIPLNGFAEAGGNKLLLLPEEDCSARAKCKTECEVNLKNVKEYNACAKSKGMQECQTELKKAQATIKELFTCLAN